MHARISQGCAAYQGCPHCLHRWEPGIPRSGRKPKCIYGGYRRFLSLASPWRQKSFRWNGQVYWFRKVETRNWPKKRTMQTAAECAPLATKSKPYCGHKQGAPFLSKWRGFTWTNMGDLMHDLKTVCDMTLKTLVGKGKYGMYESWSKDDRHRFECRACNIFPEVHDDNSPFPWRLTREEVKIVNARICRMWWPHYVHKLAKRGHSFLQKSCRMWKARDKLAVFLVILPTVLRGCVPAVYQALLTVAYALRRLEGQVVSAAEARRQGVLPGSRVINKRDLPGIHKDLVRGLVMMEGSLPFSNINPAMHHLVHYAVLTAKFGSLRLVLCYTLFFDYLLLHH